MNQALTEDESNVNSYSKKKFIHNKDILIKYQSINLFICFVLQNEKYTNICEKKFSKAQEGSEMTIRSSSQLPPSK